MRSQLTIRMPDDLRTELEAAARKRGHNLTDELLWRLRLSFAKEREQRRDPAMRALTFLIGELAENIHHGFRMKWHKNPFMFQALKLGTTKVLDAIAPPGEIESPYKDMTYKEKLSWKSADSMNRALQTIADKHRTPEDAARWAADFVLTRLFDQRTENMSTLRALTDKFPDEPLFRMMADDMERYHYGMSAAFRDLGLEETKEPKL